MQRPPTNPLSMLLPRIARLPVSIILLTAAPGLIAAPANTPPAVRRNSVSPRHSPHAASRLPAVEPTAAATAHGESALAGITVDQSSKGIALSSARAAIQARFTLATGKFDVGSAGINPLGSASLRFRKDGRTYRFQSGLSIMNTSAESGADRVGPYRSISVLWKADDAAGTLIRTSVRIYAAAADIVFEQSFPNGISDMAAIGFSNVGCAFPVFEAPQVAPQALRWLSYTYQDWPIPIRGAG